LVLGRDLASNTDRKCATTGSPPLVGQPTRGATRTHRRGQNDERPQVASRSETGQLLGADPFGPVPRPRRPKAPRPGTTAGRPAPADPRAGAGPVLTAHPTGTSARRRPSPANRRRPTPATAPRGSPRRRTPKITPGTVPWAAEPVVRARRPPTKHRPSVPVKGPDDRFAKPTPG